MKSLESQPPPTKKIPTVEEFKAGYYKHDESKHQELSQERISELWEDLDEVGKTKALGYLPVATLIYDCGVTDLQKLADSYQERGLRYKFMYYDDGNLFNLTVWDESMLQELLSAHHEILEKYDWPDTPEAFIDKAKETTAERGPLYDLIAWAYNDRRYRASVVE